MMSLDDIGSLVAHLQRSNNKCYLAMPIAVGTNSRHITNFIAELKEKGYRSMVRTTEFGDEIVVTDKVA